jgi:hypothetical protein
MTCVELGGGCLQLVVGAVCLDAGVREEKEEIGEATCDLLTFTDGITDRNIPSVIPLAILTVNGSRHCTEILV